MTNFLKGFNSNNLGQTKQFNQNTKIKEFFKKSIKLKINSKD